MYFRYLEPRGGMSAAWGMCAVAMTTLSTMTILGNACVLIGLRRVRRAPTHYPLASLAAADLLLGFFILPIATARELFVFQLNTTICSYWKTLDILCCTASILSLCVLGWERWSGITAPLARARRAKRARLLACLVWPVSLAVAVPTSFISSLRHLDEVEAYAKTCPDNTNIGYVFYSATFSFYLPAVVMVVLYTRILSALSVPPQIRTHRGGSPQINGQRDTSANESSIESNNNNIIHKSPKYASHLNLAGELRNDGGSSTPTTAFGQHVGAASNIINRQRLATKTIIRLMGLFLICWTPFFVVLPIDSFCDCVHDPIWEWCTWLGYCNSALNPLVYASASVRRAVHTSFTSSSRREDLPLTPSRR